MNTWARFGDLPVAVFGATGEIGDDRLVAALAWAAIADHPAAGWPHPHNPASEIPRTGFATWPIHTAVDWAVLQGRAGPSACHNPAAERAPVNRSGRNILLLHGYCSAR